MTSARHCSIDLASTPYYHIVSRCAQSSFLCGEDPLTGKNFDHRKQWLVDHIKTLGEIFSIDVCAYSAMSNHYHLILHVDLAPTKQWTDREVIERWANLFPKSIAASAVAGQSLTPAQRNAIDLQVDTWRERLSDISWFMRCINEPLARLANQEDGCTGRFWEGRFKSQALLDEGALFTCMAYVDLNPIRAGICQTLEDSDFTSIQARIEAYQQNQKNKHQEKSLDTTDQYPNQPSQLLPFDAYLRQEPSQTTLPMNFTDYLTLVEWTGQAIRDDKKGAIPAHITPILQRLDIDQAQWLVSVKYFHSRFYRMIGKLSCLQQACRHMGQSWLKGLGAVKALYVDPVK